MKKLFCTLIILVTLPLTAHAWTLSWDDIMGEDGYIVRYKDYPDGYSYPDNPAPANLIQDMTAAGFVTLGANITKWDLPSDIMTPGSRYVFVVQSTFSGSVSGYSDYLCWTYPLPADIIEKEIESGANIQINIYQKP